jgi:hypothetical protein
MLLGLAIFAIIATGTYTVLGGALRLERTIRVVHNECQDARLGFKLITQDIENAIAYPFDKARSDRMAFEGHPQRAAFFVPTDEGIMQLEYYVGPLGAERLDEADGGEVHRKQYLVRRRLPLKNILAGQEDAVEEGMLIGNVAVNGLRLSYGVISQGDAGKRDVTFQDDWKDNVLPDVIRLELTLEGSQPRTLRRDFFLMARGPVI